MFIPLLRIRDVYPGSRIRIFYLPDPGSRAKNVPGSRIRIRIRIRIKEFKYLNPKNCFHALGHMIQGVRIGSGS
jgi:hypothetical protein